MSLAAFDVQDKEIKIIDIAMKYRYESPASFTRAFREMHGTSPMLARKQGLSLKTYPRFFQNYGFERYVIFNCRRRGYTGPFMDEFYG